MRHVFYQVADNDKYSVWLYADDFWDEGILRTQCEFRKEYKDHIHHTIHVPVPNPIKVASLENKVNINDQTVLITKRDALELFVTHRKSIEDAIPETVEV